MVKYDSDVKLWSIYRLYDPRAYKNTKYVGITSYPVIRRLKEHIIGSKENKAKSEWIQSLVVIEILPAIEVIEFVLGSKKDAVTQEKKQINYYIASGQTLFNIIDNSIFRDGVRWIKQADNTWDVWLSHNDKYTYIGKSKSYGNTYGLNIYQKILELKKGCYENSR